MIYAFKSEFISSGSRSFGLYQSSLIIFCYTLEKPRTFVGIIWKAHVLLSLSLGAFPRPKIILLTSIWFFLNFFLLKSFYFSLSVQDVSCLTYLKIWARSFIAFENRTNSLFSSGSNSSLNFFSMRLMPPNKRMKYVLNRSSSIASPRISLVTLVCSKKIML